MPRPTLRRCRATRSTVPTAPHVTSRAAWARPKASPANITTASRGWTTMARVTTTPWWAAFCRPMRWMATWQAWILTPTWAAIPRPSATPVGSAMRRLLGEEAAGISRRRHQIIPLPVLTLRVTFPLAAQVRREISPPVMPPWEARARGLTAPSKRHNCTCGSPS